MIYVDANILYNYIFETELTEYSLKVLSLNEPKITSDTVVNEAIFAFEKASKGKLRDYISPKTKTHP
ncbi:PIN domain-containing protein [Thermococcus sp. ES12]|nr:PIN domain-containing protein [Thermococcus sp. ES12]